MIIEKSSTTQKYVLVNAWDVSQKRQEFGKRNCTRASALKQVRIT